MILVRLALRNLLRNPRRTALTTVAVVAGVGLLILGEGFISGVEENIIVAAEDGLVGHVLARPADYPTQGLPYPVDRLLNVTGEARRLLGAEALAWTERTLFAPTAAAGEDFLRVRAIGYDPARDEAVFPRHLWRVRGSPPAPRGNEVLVSRGVARLLNLAPGGRLVLQVRTHRGAINALEVTVSGVVTTTNAALDVLGVFVPQLLARTLVGADAPSHVAVRLRHRSKAVAFSRKLAAALGAEAEVVTWQDETRDLLRLQSIRRKALDIVVAILLALAAFGMANTILMAAHERVREVGTLRSMGMTEAGVVGLFLLEGAFMGLVGSLLGVLWGGGLVWWWSRNPIDFTRIIEEQVGGNFPITAYVYTAFETTVIVGALLFGVAVAVTASIYPARVASRRAPAEAVRAE